MNPNHKSDTTAILTRKGLVIKDTEISAGWT
jgi:hypothetical protein